MRTTVKLDADVAAAVDRLRRERGIGISSAVNELARRGLSEPRRPGQFKQRSSPMGAQLDVANVAEALEALDGPAAR